MESNKKTNKNFRDTILNDTQDYLYELSNVASEAIQEIDIIHGIIDSKYDVSDKILDRLWDVRTMLANALPSTKTAKKMGWINEKSKNEYYESYNYEDDENIGDGQWHVFYYGPDFPFVEKYMIMAPTGDTWPASSRGEICDYDGEYSYSTRHEMEEDTFAFEVDGEEWTPTEIDQPYPREVQKAIRLVISRLKEEGITVDEP